MSNQKSVCGSCGTAYTRGARFCPKCGAPLAPASLGGSGTLEKATGVVDTLSSTVSKVQSTVSSAGSIAKTARDLSTITIRPPAQWKVVVAEVLPVAGKKAIDAAVSAAGQKVTAEVSQVVTERLAGSAKPPVPESFVPHLPPRTATGGTPCPSCGKAVVPGKRFCGSCGARIDEAPKPVPAPSPVCPSCGNPIIPGKKFCGSCGAKIEGAAKPTAVPPPQPVCPSCGNPVIPGKKFCGTCGYKLT